MIQENQYLVPTTAKEEEIETLTNQM